MGFAVSHTTKMGNGSGGIGSHIDRTQKNTPKNVDPERTHLNKEYVATGGTLVHDIKERIKEGYKSVNGDGTPRAIRTDAVLAVGNILSGSHKDMIELQKQGRLDEWAKANLEFFQKQYGKENIVRFTMHLDEKTPHIHCVFVPLNKDGDLTAKTIVGNKEKLSQLQTDYAEAMKPFGLERGIKNSRVNHTTTREYYAGIEHIREEAVIETNFIGQPKEGEQDRIQQVVADQQMEITRLQNEMLRNQARIEEERKKLAEAKEVLKLEQKKLEENLKQAEIKSLNLELKEKQLNEKERTIQNLIEKETTKETFKAQVNLMHQVNTRLFDFGSKLQIANLDTLKGKKDFEGFKLEFKEYPRLLEMHQLQTKRGKGFGIGN